MFDPRDRQKPGEASKLSANYLNGIGVALIAVGSFAPLFTSFYAGARQPLWIVSAISGICLVVSAALHLIARNLLKDRKP